MRRHAKASPAGSTEGSGRRRSLITLLAILALALCALGSGASAASAATATMGPVTKVFSTTAHVTGDIGSPAGTTLWRFDVSTDGGLSWTTPEGGLFNEYGSEPDTPTTVEADLRGLTPATEYLVRFATVDLGEGGAEAISPEPNPSFTTTAAVTPTPPVVLATDDASEVAFTRAKVTGEVERGAGEDPVFDADCFFEYVTEDQFNATGFEGAGQAGCEPDNPVSTPGASGVEATLTGLSPTTTYHLRLRASNSAGSDSKEASSTFTTGTVTPPAVVIDPASLITATTAHFTGEVTAGGEDPGFHSSCTFEYISDQDFQARDEIQRVTVNAAHGTFKLTFKGQETTDIPFDASASEVESALEALPAIGLGGVTVEIKPTEADDPSNAQEVEALKGKTSYALTFPGANVEEVGFDGSALTGAGKVQVTTLVPGFGKNEVQKVTVAATAGTYIFAFEGEESGPIAFDADAATVQSALEAMSAIGTANVTVTGGPGSPDGSAPYTLTFEGALAETNVPQITSDPGGLSTPTASGKVRTPSQGHAEGFEGAQPLECIPAGSVTGTTPVDVEADAGGLEPGTTYHLRLRAQNLGGAGSDTAEFTTLAVPPTISGTNASEISTTSATLNAQINPGGADTTYHFEYLTLAAFNEAGETFAGATSTPESESIGGDYQQHAASAAIAGLSPDTAYRYRAVATNAQSAPGGTPGPVASLRTDAAAPPPPDICPNEMLRAENNSLALPDCRAYELVSTELNHASLGSGAYGHALPSGDSVVYMSIDSPENANFGSVNNFVVSHRDPISGWKGAALGFPTKGPTAGFFASVSQSVSPDLKAVLSTSDQGPDGPPSTPGLHLWVTRSDGTVDQVTKYGSPYLDGANAYQGYGGFAAYYDFKSVFFKINSVQLSDDPSPGNTTYWWENGDLRILGVLPDGTPAPFGSDLPPETLLPPVSEDGTKALFTAVGEDPRSLFLRIGDAPGVNVSESQRTVEPDPKPVLVSKVGGLLPDGSAVLFTSRNELTNDAYTGRTSGGERNYAGNDLYSYDVASGELTDLTVDTNPADAETGANVTLVGTSADGSTIYFRATGNLAPGGSSGQPSLYRYRDGEIEFVSRVDGLNQAAVSQDGDAIAFTSAISLTGYDNTDPVTGDKHQEVFLARPGAPLECASCRPDGSLPTAGAELKGGRSVSNDGDRVFFESTGALVPGASSDQTKVYQYADGRLSLISAADSNSPAHFLDASASGDDVFFSIHEELVENPNGGDDAVYDARVGGGFPHPERAQCDGSSCRGGATSPPTPTPASSRTFEGPGDTPGISVAKKLTIKGSRASLRVRVPGKGKLTASGKGLKTSKLSVNKAKTATLELSLSGAAKQKLRKGKVVRSKATVTFVDAAGERSRATVSLTFKPASGRGK